MNYSVSELRKMRLLRLDKSDNYMSSRLESKIDCKNRYIIWKKRSFEWSDHVKRFFQILRLQAQII